MIPGGAGGRGIGATFCACCWAGTITRKYTNSPLTMSGPRIAVISVTVTVSRLIAFQIRLAGRREGTGGVEKTRVDVVEVVRGVVATILHSTRLTTREGDRLFPDHVLDTESLCII